MRLLDELDLVGVDLIGEVASVVEVVGDLALALLDHLLARHLHHLHARQLLGRERAAQYLAIEGRVLGVAHIVAYGHDARVVALVALAVGPQQRVEHGLDAIDQLAQLLVAHLDELVLRRLLHAMAELFFEAATSGRACLFLDLVWREWNGRGCCRRRMCGIVCSRCAQYALALLLLELLLLLLLLVAARCCCCCSLATHTSGANFVVSTFQILVT